MNINHDILLLVLGFGAYRILIVYMVCVYSCVGKECIIHFVLKIQFNTNSIDQDEKTPRGAVKVVSSLLLFCLSLFECHSKASHGRFQKFKHCQETSSVQAFDGAPFSLAK